MDTGELLEQYDTVADTRQAAWDLHSIAEGVIILLAA